MKFLFLILVSLCFYNLAKAQANTTNAGPAAEGGVTAPAAESSSENEKVAKKAGDVSIEMQWEESKNAATYEIQILDQNKKVFKTVKSKTSQIKFSVPINRYKIRGRYITKWGNQSPWSSEEALEVAPPKPKIPAESLKDPFEFVSNKEKPSQRMVKLNWKPVDQVAKYKVRIYSKDKKTILKEFETDKTTFEFEVTPGEFVVSISSLGPQNIESNELFIPKTLKIEKNKLPPPEIEKVAEDKKPGQFQIQFKKNDGFMVVGEVYYASFLGQQWLMIDKKENLEKVSSTDFQKPGRYKITYWADGKDVLASEKLTTEEFIVKPRESDLN